VTKQIQLSEHQMKSDRKAELKQAYRETVIRKGIFKVHSTTSGETWIESSPNIDTIKNRVWFTLGMGNHPNRRLQETWNTSGADAMEFEIIEIFPDDLSGVALENTIKERKEFWMKELGAQRYS
jgi:hypothetical protein